MRFNRVFNWYNGGWALKMVADGQWLSSQQVQWACSTNGVQWIGHYWSSCAQHYTVRAKGLLISGVCHLISCLGK
ncbi:MAG: hypothetical protein QF535_19370 [Anaerolineales bacterium]|nr:hypothetical protein [Anaerolineales bacterium]